MKKNISIIFIQLGILVLCASLSAAAKQPTIKAIQFASSTVNEDRVIFKLNGSYLPTTFAMKGDKPRVVFDFPQTKPALGVKSIINADGHFIKRIRMAMHSGKKPKTRVVFDLQSNQPVQFDQHFNKVDHILVISVHPTGSKPEPAITVKKTEPITQKVTVETRKTEPEPQELSHEAEQPEPAITSEASENGAVEEPRQEARQKPEVTAAPEPKAAQKQPVQESRLAPPPPILTAKPELLRAAQPETKAVSKPQVHEATEEKIQEPPPLKEPPASLFGKPEKEPLQDNTKPVLKSIKFDNSTNRGEMIRFKLNGFFPPVVNGLEEDIPRVICFFKDGSTLKSLQNLIKTNGRYVSAIRTQSFRNPDNLRVILDLVPGNNYDLRQVFFKKDSTFMLIINSDGKVSTPKTQIKMSNSIQ